MTAAAVALSVDVALDYRLESSSSILLAIEALGDAHQQVTAEQLLLNGQPLGPSTAIGDNSARYRWLALGAGDLAIRYSATVLVERATADIFHLPVTPLSHIPPHIAPFLFASRHCDPARFDRVLADDMNLPLGWVADGSTILAIRDWIRGHLSYEPVSTAETTATDTYVGRAGVCRDYAHLMIALARSAGVPARFVSCYAWQLDPPDFHAVAEVWMGGRWHLIDATGLAPESSLIAIARTRDAVDASFMTVFGSAEMLDQSVTVVAG